MAGKISSGVLDLTNAKFKLHLPLDGVDSKSNGTTGVFI